MRNRKLAALYGILAFCFAISAGIQISAGNMKLGILWVVGAFAYAINAMVNWGRNSGKNDKE